MSTVLYSTVSVSMGWGVVKWPEYALPLYRTRNVRIGCRADLGLAAIRIYRYRGGDHRIQVTGYSGSTVLSRILLAQSCVTPPTYTQAKGDCASILDSIAKGTSCFHFFLHGASLHRHSLNVII